jgi:hypothetical protein
LPSSSLIRLSGSENLCLPNSFQTIGSTCPMAYRTNAADVPCILTQIRRNPMKFSFTCILIDFSLALCQFFAYIFGSSLELFPSL